MFPDDPYLMPKNAANFVSISFQIFDSIPLDPLHLGFSSYKRKAIRFLFSSVYFRMHNDGSISLHATEIHPVHTKCSLPAHAGTFQLTQLCKHSCKLVAYLLSSVSPCSENSNSVREALKLCLETMNLWCSKC